MKSYEELLGIYSGYLKMVEVLTAKITPQTDIKEIQRANNWSKAYRIK